MRESSCRTRCLPGGALALCAALAPGVALAGESAPKPVPAPYEEHVQVITTKVPDIRLQNPDSTVAIITNSKRRRSKRRPSRVLRMMMKGAANTRNGTAAKVFGATPSCNRPKPAGRCATAWYPLTSAPASAKPMQIAKNVLRASGVIGTVRLTQRRSLPVTNSAG